MRLRSLVGAKTIAIYGDSRAAMWNIPISNVAAKKGWKVRVFGLGGCLVPNLQFISYQTNSPNAQCDTYHQVAVEAILAVKPALIITTSVANQKLVDGNHPTPEQWADGWKSTFAALAPSGATLAMTGDIPGWPRQRCPLSCPQPR